MKQKITVGGKGDANPLSATPENVHAGQKAFGQYCAVCHGLDGQATGVPFADRMSPPVPSLASSEVQSYKDGQLKWIIDNGIYPSGMPASKGLFSDDQIWSIVDYVRHLPPKGSLGEPPVYTGALPDQTSDVSSPPTSLEAAGKPHVIERRDDHEFTRASRPLLNNHDKENTMFEGLFQPVHLIILFVVAVLVLGPRKLPELGKGLGEGIRSFKSAIKDASDSNAAR